VFAALDQYADRAVPSWRVAELCQLAAVRLPPSAAGRAAAFADSVTASGAFEDGPIRQDIVAFAEILRFRYRMLEELR
jgi:hypothetical protein